MAMPIRPVPPLHRHRRHRAAAEDQPFILRSELDATILRMISTHSMAAFTPSVDRTAPAQKPRDAVPVPPASGGATTVSAPAAQRTLEAVPVPPSRPMPRGSLLDLRV